MKSLSRHIPLVVLLGSLAAAVPAQAQDFVLEPPAPALPVRSNTTRIHFLLPSSYGPAVLALLEAFVQCRLRPEFEGFASQHGVQQFVQADARKAARRLTPALDIGMPSGES